jgi:hypothetical protein
LEGLGGVFLDALGFNLILSVDSPGQHILLLEKLLFLLEKLLIADFEFVARLPLQTLSLSEGY